MIIINAIIGRSLERCIGVVVLLTLFLCHAEINLWRAGIAMAGGSFVCRVGTNEYILKFAYSEQGGQ
jgi:hypothetical protein